MNRLDLILRRDGRFTRSLDRLLSLVAPTLRASAAEYVGYTCCPIQENKRCDVYYTRSTGTYSCVNCSFASFC
jgi:hypothetical protein